MQVNSSSVSQGSEVFLKPQKEHFEKNQKITKQAEKVFSGQPSVCSDEVISKKGELPQILKMIAVRNSDFSEISNMEFALELMFSFMCEISGSKKKTQEAQFEKVFSLLLNLPLARILQTVNVKKILKDIPVNEIQRYSDVNISLVIELLTEIKSQIQVRVHEKIDFMIFVLKAVKKCNESPSSDYSEFTEKRLGFPSSNDETASYDINKTFSNILERLYLLRFVFNSFKDKLINSNQDLLRDEFPNLFGFGNVISKMINYVNKTKKKVTTSKVIDLKSLMSIYEYVDKNTLNCCSDVSQLLQLSNQPNFMDSITWEFKPDHLGSRVEKPNERIEQKLSLIAFQYFAGSVSWARSGVVKEVLTEIEVWTMKQSKSLNIPYIRTVLCSLGEMQKKLSATNLGKFSNAIPKTKGLNREAQQAQISFSLKSISSSVEAINNCLRFSEIQGGNVTTYLYRSLSVLRWVLNTVEKDVLVNIITQIQQSLEAVESGIKQKRGTYQQKIDLLQTDLHKICSLLEIFDEYSNGVLKDLENFSEHFLLSNEPDIIEEPVVTEEKPTATQAVLPELKIKAPEATLFPQVKVHLEMEDVTEIKKAVDAAKDFSAGIDTSTFLGRNAKRREIIKQLKKLGYHIDRGHGKGSHVFCTQPGKKPITLPNSATISLGVQKNIEDSINGVSSEECKQEGKKETPVTSVGRKHAKAKRKTKKKKSKKH
ncbi:MAG: type II toxin-antitoxin system HicA family toxin [Chlamydiota bacterium]|nr:type II toxin-antitoxin system HicA family toxin [Chlamydiota bacterium]